MSTAVKPARKSSVLTEAVMRQAEQAREEKKTEAVTADQKFPKIKENTFFQVVFAEGKPEEKRSAIAKARTFSGTKEEMRQREKAYEEFKEYLAYQRELMSSQIISLQDNETFGLLQTVYGGFTDRLRDFDKKIEPLTRVLTSLFNLRTNNVSFDAIDQIERDREHERGIQAKIEANGERLKDIEFSSGASTTISPTCAPRRACSASATSRLRPRARLHAMNRRSSACGATPRPSSRTTPSSRQSAKPRAMPTKSWRRSPASSPICASCSTSAPTSTRSARKS